MVGLLAQHLVAKCACATRQLLVGSIELVGPQGAVSQSPEGLRKEAGGGHTSWLEACWDAASSHEPPADDLDRGRARFFPDHAVLLWPIHVGAGFCLRHLGLKMWPVTTRAASAHRIHPENPKCKWRKLRESKVSIDPVPMSPKCLPATHLLPSGVSPPPSLAHSHSALQPQLVCPFLRGFPCP